MEINKYFSRKMRCVLNCVECFLDFALRFNRVDEIYDNLWIDMEI